MAEKRQGDSATAGRPKKAKLDTEAEVETKADWEFFIAR